MKPLPHSRSVRQASGSQHWVCSGLSTGITGSFEEAFATLEVGTNSLFGAAVALLALGFAARFRRSPQGTSRTIINVAGFFFVAAFII